MKSGSFFNLVRFLCVIGSILGLGSAVTGCASAGNKAAIEILSKSDKVYARVYKVVPWESDAVPKACEAERNSRYTSLICSDIASYEVAKLHFMHMDSRLLQGAAFVPKAHHVQERDIVELNPSRGLARYTRVVPREDTEQCRWVGPTPETLNSRSATAGGFIAGVLIIPAVVMLSTDILSSGVECENWSYRTIVDQARSR